MDEGKAPLKTKIICTLGPSSRDEEMLKRMAVAGMDVARINSGHCDVDEVRDYVMAVRRAAEGVGKRVGVMLDLQGPRLRVGPIQGSSVELKRGQEFTFTTKQKRGGNERVSVEYKGLPNDLKPGDDILVDDGLIRMKVKEISADEIICEVLEGGTLLQGKGMNFPDSDLRLSAFTDRDRRYLAAGLEAEVDWVAQSFVRTAGDLRDLTGAIQTAGKNVPVMAKIEKPEAVRNIDEIIPEADGIMVARGDLGVEMEAEDVPLVQKDLINKAVHAALPVVTATQMLESMVSRPRPTRAEASDVANAILDGADAVMLSAETAIGLFPLKSVETVSRIAVKAERAIDYTRILDERGRWAHRSIADAIGYAACKIASDVKAKAIIIMTRTGETAKLIARYRPEASILVVSPSERVIDATAVSWGARGLLIAEHDDLKRLIEAASETCVDAGFLSKGDVAVMTGGFFDEESSNTNVVHVHTVR